MEQKQRACRQLLSPWCGICNGWMPAEAAGQTLRQKACGLLSGNTSCRPTPSPPALQRLPIASKYGHTCR